MYLSSYVVLVKRNAKPDAVMAILCQVALDACVVERERERERERELDADKQFVLIHLSPLLKIFVHYEERSQCHADSTMQLAGTES